MSPCQYTNRGKLQSSITFTTIVFLHIVPQYLLITKDNPPLLQTFILTFNITTFFVYLYLLLTMVNKGYVKDENSNASLLKRIVQFKKYCYRCKTYRPERSHHCSKCNKCIKKMDHHCFWINTCVNNDNLGHFVRFLFFACIATFELVLYMTYRIVGDMRKGQFVDHRFMLFFEVFIVLYAILVCVILALFVVAQMRYILKNITFLEKEAVSNLIKYAVPPEHNPYDRGKWNNFVDVFGSPKGLFLFKGKGDGFTFKKTYDVEQWPPARGSKRMSEYSSKRVVDMEEV